MENHENGSESKARHRMYRRNGKGTPLQGAAPRIGGLTESDQKAWDDGRIGGDAHNFEEESEKKKDMSRKRGRDVTSV